MSRKPVRVSRRDNDICEKENSLYESKYLLPIAVIVFVSTIIILRSLAALQSVGVVLVPPVVIIDFHLHHWLIGMLASVFLAILLVVYKSDKVVSFYLVILLAFFLGLFVDGVIYYNSFQFFE